MKYYFEEQLKRIIASCGKDIEIECIDTNVNLIDDLGFDSVGIVNLIIELECEFDIEIDDQYLVLEKLSTYTGLIEIVHEKLGDNKKNEC